MQVPFRRSFPKKKKVTYSFNGFCYSYMCRRYLCIHWHWVRPLFPVEWYYFSCYSLMYTWYCSFKAGTKPFTTKEKYLLWHHWLKSGQKSPPMNGLQGQVAVNLYPRVILLIAETFPTAGSELQLFFFLITIVLPCSWVRVFVWPTDCWGQVSKWLLCIHNLSKCMFSFHQLSKSVVLIFAII